MGFFVKNFMNFKIIYCALFLFIGCQPSFVSVEKVDGSVSSQTQEYRTIHTPLDSYKTWSKPLSEWESLCLEWEVAHEHLVHSIGKGKLATAEAHRKVIHCLQSLAQISQSQEWKQFIGSYENLYASVEIGNSSRTLFYKYQDIQKKIKNFTLVPSEL
jgi:hypothetical protein